ncbi:Mur ligase family protein [Calditrichota bacterium LG25]
MFGKPGFKEDFISEKEKKEILRRRQAFTNPIIAVTGNLGKTSTISMIETILSARGRVLRHPNGCGNLQNNFSTLKKLNNTYDFGLFELNHQKGRQFVELVHLIRPNIAIVTNLGDAHLNYLERMIRHAIEKASLLKYMDQDGIAILNKDDELSYNIVKQIKNLNVIQFGLNPHADFYATDIEQFGPGGMRFKLNGRFEIQLPIFSIQDLYNFLAAVAAVAHIGFSLNDVVEILNTKFSLPDGRGKVLKYGSIYVIDESYISTPRSLSKAARVLSTFEQYSEQLILIVGDMADAGINVEQQHINMGYFLSALPIDLLITVGEYAKFIGKGFEFIKTSKKLCFSVNSLNEVFEILDIHLKNKSTIAIKGLGKVAMHRFQSYFKMQQPVSTIN